MCRHVVRWQASRDVRNPTWDSPPISSPFSATRYIPQGGTTPVPVLSFVHPPSSLETDLQPLPVVASHCPGFVCYAEKTTPQLLPYVSRVKSAQQVIGTVLKCILTQPPSSTGGAGSEKCSGGSGRILPYDAQDIYHVSIQPCFDKKLEGSRQVGIACDLLI